MKSLGEIKKEERAKINALTEECSMFFAFSNEQFSKNMTPLQEGEKYVSLGSGCFMPKGKVERYKQGIKEINAWVKNAVNDNKLRKQNIEDALNNHEAFYTGEIEPALDELGSDYSEKEVREVYEAIVLQ